METMAKSRTLRSIGLAACLAVVASCTSTTVPPDALAALAAEDERAARALAHWEQGVQFANAFLASDESVTLPSGRFELTGDGLRYVTETEAHPIEVRVRWSPAVSWFGIDGQERSWGFAVGRRGEGDALYANSLFRDDGHDWSHPVHVGGLMLHETAHVVFDVGALGFWKGTAYCLEMLLLFRYRDHSGERLPYAVTDEYHGWVQANVEF
jgi:hypothetical protein